MIAESNTLAISLRALTIEYMKEKKIKGNKTEHKFWEKARNKCSDFDSRREIMKKRKHGIFVIYSSWKCLRLYWFSETDDSGSFVIMILLRVGCLFGWFIKYNPVTSTESMELGEEKGKKKRISVFLSEQ